MDWVWTLLSVLFVVAIVAMWLGGVLWSHRVRTRREAEDRELAAEEHRAVFEAGPSTDETRDPGGDRPPDRV